MALASDSNAFESPLRRAFFMSVSKVQHCLEQIMVYEGFGLIDCA